jgi:hypothetical protein
LDDEEALVRHHAAESLIETLDLPAEKNDMGIYELAIEVMMEEKERSERAVATLREMVQGATK